MLPIVKDSGARESYTSGMVRDTQEGKPMFGLIMREGIPFEKQMLVRWAALMTAGAKKYGLRNWEKADSDEEMNRFKESAFRHFMQWFAGHEDEDHAAAVMFNINAYESTKVVIRQTPEKKETHNERDVKLDAKVLEPVCWNVGPDCRGYLDSCGGCALHCVCLYPKVDTRHRGCGCPLDVNLGWYKD